MKNLFVKEFRLAMHPTVPIMTLLAAMVLIPNYPYTVIFFYAELALYFMCLQGRENADVVFSVLLPVARRDVVRARVAFAAAWQLAQLALVALLSPLHAGANLAGMDANAALLGEGFVCFGVFNAVFFPAYYRDVARVGVSFLRAAAAHFLLVALDVASSYAVPFVRDVLDTPGTEHAAAKLAFCAGCAVFYAAATWLSCRASERRFAALDL